MGQTNYLNWNVASEQTISHWKKNSVWPLAIIAIRVKSYQKNRNTAKFVLVLILLTLINTHCKKVIHSILDKYSENGELKKMTRIIQFTKWLTIIYL